MASGTTIANMNIKLQFDGKELTSSMSGIEKESKSWAGKLGGAAKTAGKTIAAGLAIGATGVVAITKAAASAYADYEQLAGGVETLFKDSQDTIFQYSQDAYRTAGLSANEYMETVTSFSASLLQGLGGDTAAAAEVANKAVVDMSDNANKMGTDIGRIQDAYQGFAKQNYTMLDNLKLGYGGTASEMARLINDSGVLGKSMKVTAKTVNDVSFDKMIEAIHVVQDNLGITGTTAKEANETISGSLNSMKAAWGNLLAFFGGGTTMAWDDIFPAFVDSVKTFAANVTPVLQDVLSGVSSLIKDLAPEIVKALPGLVKEVMPPLIEAVINIIQALATALPEILSGLLEAIVAAIPQLVDALVAAVPVFIQGLIQVAMMVIQQLPTILTSIVDGIMQIETMLTQPQHLQMILQAGLQLLLKLVEAIPQVIVAVVNALPDIISNIVQFLLDPANIGMIIAAAAQLFMGLVTAVPQILGALLGVFGSLVGEFFGIIGNFFGDVAANVGEFVNTMIAPIGEFFSWLGGILANAAQWVWDHTLGPILDFVDNIAIFVIAIVANLLQGVYNVFIQPLINFFTGLWQTITSIVQNIIDGIVGFFTPIVEWFSTNIIAPIGDFFAGLWNGIVEGVTSFVSTVTNIIGAISGWINDNVIQPVANFFNGLWEGIKTGIGALKAAIQTVFDVIVGIIKAPINGIISAINGVIDGINSVKVPDWVPFIGGASANLGHIPTLAQGGYASNATAAIFGEAGPEVALPLENNTGNWAGLLATTLAAEMRDQELIEEGSRQVVVNFYDTTVRDDNDIQKITQGISQVMRRAA